MSREVHVRFWERLGVRFPRAARHNRKSRSLAHNVCSCLLSEGLRQAFESGHQIQRQSATSRAIRPKVSFLSFYVSCTPRCGLSGWWRGSSGGVESPGGISPPGAPRTVREPLGSYGSRCSAVSMTELPVGKERWIGPAQPVKPVSRPFGLATQPLELAACPANDIEIDPLEGRT